MDSNTQNQIIISREAGSRSARKIAFDLRSLSSGQFSGVENYCINLLDNLLQLDRENQYMLFYNSYKANYLPDFHYINSQSKTNKIPNRLLNLAFKFGFKKIEDFTGDVDWFFMPNLNQFNIKPETKLAITVHDLSPVITPEFYNLKRRIWHKFLNYKQAFERADILFAVSEHTKNDLIKIFNIDPKKIVVAYPSANFENPSEKVLEQSLRSARNIYNLPGEYFLFLNTIEPRKNLAGLIKAFEKINGPEYLVIAGRRGWKNGRDFRLIKNSIKSDKIKYVGHVDESLKPAVIKMAKALVYPSFYEGFGFQALEAMAVGTPVIASQITSLPEVIDNAGLLINPYDPNSITTALNQISTDEKLKSMLVDLGYKRVLDFSWKNTAKQILENLKKV